MEKLEVLDLLERIVLLYPNSKIQATMETLEAWHMVLDDCDAKAANDNLTVYVKEGNKFPPNASELYVQKIPYREETDYELSKKKMAEIDELNKNYERMTPEQKEYVANVKRDIEQFLRNRQSTDV